MVGRRVDEIIEELGSPSVPPTGLPLSRLIDLRHELSALIRSELYGGGNKVDGRSALKVRRALDEFFFHTEQSQLVRGKVADLEVLKRAIILETLGEQADLLGHAQDAGGGSGKGIKAEMLKLLGDPDRMDRFNDTDKEAIRKIACGSSFFAKKRVTRLNEAIRTRGIPYMRP